jgi:hypothetical protein
MMMAADSSRSSLQKQEVTENSESKVGGGGGGGGAPFLNELEHEKRQRLLGEGAQCRRKKKRMLETSGSREEEGVATTEVDAQAMGARRLCDARRERQREMGSIPVY